jgi:hypothetical protein
VLVCGNDVMAIGARDAAIRLLNRHVRGDLAIMGQDGITIASWECHDLTSLALDHLAFIDAIVQLIEGHETGHGAAPTIVVKCKGSVGFNHLRLHLRHSSLFLFRRPDLVDHKSRCHSSNFRPIPAGWANSNHNRSRGAGGRWLSWLLGCDAPPAL